MAYPVPVPPLRGKEAREFVKRLENFKLTPEQKKFYREGREALDKRKMEGDINQFCEHYSGLVRFNGIPTILCMRCMDTIGEPRLVLSCHKCRHFEGEI